MCVAYVNHWKCEYFFLALVACADVFWALQAPFAFDQTTQDYKYDNICVDRNMDIDAYDFLLKVLAPRPLHRLNLRRMKMHPVFCAMSVSLCRFSKIYLVMSAVSDWSALSAGKIEAPSPSPCKL
jgi:hypothetical protein